MAGASMSRRGFCAAATSGLAGLSVLSRSAFGANERIRIGLIGTGDRCGAHIQELSNLRTSHNVEMTAVCDVWRPNRESAAARVEKIAGTAPFQTSRFGDLLARDDVDAVIIATPDFAHTPIMIEALKAGKDVYVEKPMSLTVEEANEALDLARQNERVVQVGTQRRSEGRWKAARKLIESGQVGPITRVSSANYFNHPRWARDFSDCKEDAVDWDAYLFNRPKVAFDPRLLRRWHLYRMCTNGLSGLWMTHLVDALHNVMGATYPNSAVALGGIYLWKDGREHSDVFHALLDYPEGFIYDWGMGLTNGAGTHYTIHGRYGTIDMEKQTYSGEGGEQGKEIAAGSLEAVPDENHMANWLDCIRSRQRPTADIAFGHQHSVATIMAAAALDTGQRMRYDRDQRKISAG
ncbi:MAG TPA: Gfo/Idh/MocA family oxidoreductase [Candidatus Hydrogenedentes bacterium]|nr:Gfo/Idh/MocA family oxidoreductase [Candidatus Hydrogenedentota bacterium]HPG66396.1 Gfo/Idh/MocA family oxidoreductase [Candidatus Hydrogenedentota bacterium]